MPYNATNSDSFGSLASDTFQTQAKNITFTAKGLRASTQYDCFVEGQSYGWAARQFGKGLGEPLVSDSSGSLVFSILVEVPFSQNYGQVQGITPTPTETAFQSQAPSNNYRQSRKMLELRAPGSTLQFQIPATYIFIPAKPNSIDEGY